MKNGNTLEQKVINAISGDDRISWGEADIRVDMSNRTVYLRGKVGRLADKRRASNDALAVAGVDAVVNNLLVEAPPAMADEGIRKHIVGGLEQDPWIDHTRIRVSVERGIATLEGEVQSLLRKRLVGASAWWVPGVREVINNLSVLYPEPDSDEQITDACKTVLEKDPFVDAVEVLVRTHHGVVTLLGSVCSEGEKEMAEDDCWYVLGVEDVVNRLSVSPAGQIGQVAS